MSFNCTLPSLDPSLVKEAITLDKTAKQACMKVMWHGRPLTIKIHFFNDKFTDVEATKEIDLSIDKLLVLADVYKLGLEGEKTSSIKLSNQNNISREFHPPAQGEAAKQPKSYTMCPLELLKAKIERVKKRISLNKFKKDEKLESANQRIAGLENAVKIFEQIDKKEPAAKPEVKSEAKDKPEEKPVPVEPPKQDIPAVQG